MNATTLALCQAPFLIHHASSKNFLTNDKIWSKWEHNSAEILTFFWLVWLDFISKGKNLLWVKGDNYKQNFNEVNPLGRLRNTSKAEHVGNADFEF